MLTLLTTYMQTLLSHKQSRWTDGRWTTAASACVPAFIGDCHAPRSSHRIARTAPKKKKEEQQSRGMTKPHHVSMDAGDPTLATKSLRNHHACTLETVGRPADVRPPLLTYAHRC